MYIESVICTSQHTLEQWQKVFWLSAVVSCGTYIFFQAFGTADIQAWNYPQQKIPVDIILSQQPLNCKQNGTAGKDDGEEAED
jgi:hypothetical protein